MFANIKFSLLFFITIIVMIFGSNQTFLAREKVQDLEKLRIKWGMTKAEFMKNKPDIWLDMEQYIIINVNYLGHNIKADLLFTRFPHKKYPDYLFLIMCDIGIKDINHQNVIDTVKDFRLSNDHLIKVNGKPLRITDPCLKKDDYNCYLAALKKGSGFGALWEIDMIDINNNKIKLEIINIAHIIENKIYHSIDFRVQ